MPTSEHRIFTMKVSSVYPHYVTKVEKKGRTVAELNEVIRWLTGYSQPALDDLLADGVHFRDFFGRAPALHPNCDLITGVICGVRVEEVADPLMQKIRWMDKLVDELAKGRPMTKILRQRS
jgi:hypothetical protein